MNNTTDLKLVKMNDDEWFFQYPTSSDALALNDEFNRALDHFDEGKYDIAETMLISLVDKDLTNIDALHHISLICDMTSREDEAFLYCKDAVQVGLDAIPKDFTWKKSKMEWGFLENRPFMRAYHNLGLWQHRKGHVDLSIEIFSNLLSISPNDNLGVRLILPRLWLEQGDISSLIRHCKEFKDEYSAEILYAYPLALIMSQETTKAKKLLAQAKNEFPLIAKELLKKEHKRPKSSMPGYISDGGADQAYEYWLDYGKFWLSNDEAMTLLRRA